MKNWRSITGKMNKGPLCGPGSEGSKGKVLKMDGPSAQGFLSLTAFQAEGCGLPLCGNAYEVSVTGFAFLCHRAK